MSERNYSKNKNNNMVRITCDSDLRRGLKFVLLGILFRVLAEEEEEEEKEEEFKAD